MNPYDTEETMKKNPFLVLGFGINIYFDTLIGLMVLFGVFTLLQLPAMYMYSQYSGMSSLTQYGVGQYMLGNLGYAKTKCVSVSLGVDDVELTCPEGHIGEIESYGVIPKSFKDKDICYQKNATVCDEYFDSDALMRDVKDRCIESSDDPDGQPLQKASCHINDIDQYIKTSDTECTDEETIFYI